MGLKYILLDETKVFEGRTLHRIEALKDFRRVSKGEKGGWIEKEDNLSQEGDCWVGGEAKVYDDAIVCDDARLNGNAQAYGRAEVRANARVNGDAKVFGRAKVFAHARVRGDARVYGCTEVCGNALVNGNAEVYDDAQVYDNGRVNDNAKVCETAVVNGQAEICGDAVVEKMGDYIVFQNWWSSGRYFTYTKSNGKWKVGCFHGTGEELVKKAYADDRKKGECYETIVKAVEKINSIL